MGVRTPPMNSWIATDTPSRPWTRTNVPRTTGTELFGDLRQIVGPNGTLSYDYDNYGRMLSSTDAAVGGTTTATYNGLDEIVTSLDPANRPTTVYYDELGRTKRVENADGTTRFSYDAGANALGRLTQTVSPTGQQTDYTFEPKGSGTNRGLLATVSKSLLPPGANSSTTPIQLTTTFHFDEFSRLKQVDYPGASNFAVEYGFDGAGNVISAADPTNSATVYWRISDVDQGYRLKQETLGNGVTTDRHYEALSGHLDSITTKHVNTPLQQLKYVYTNDNLTRRTDVSSGVSETFGYDALNRVKSTTYSNRSGSETITYDPVSNAISKKDPVGDYTYQAQGRIGSSRPGIRNTRRIPSATFKHGLARTCLAACRSTPTPRSTCRRTSLSKAAQRRASTLPTTLMARAWSSRPIPKSPTTPVTCTSSPPPRAARSQRFMIYAGGARGRSGDSSVQFCACGRELLARRRTRVDREHHRRRRFSDRWTSLRCVRRCARPHRRRRASTLRIHRPRAGSRARAREHARSDVRSAPRAIHVARSGNSVALWARVESVRVRVQQPVEFHRSVGFHFRGGLLGKMVSLSACRSPPVSSRPFGRVLEAARQQSRAQRGRPSLPPLSRTQQPPPRRVALRGQPSGSTS